MSFSDTSGGLADRLKKVREKQAAAKQEQEKPVDYQELYTLRGRILGVLIRDARLAKGRTVADCAASVGIDEQVLQQWEFGQAQPSLPQIELLAYELGVPVSHFWATETMSKDNAHPLPQAEYVTLRDRVVGALLRQAREKAGLELAALSENTGIPAEQIEAYEVGKNPVPLAELTSLASATNVSLSYFLENNNRIGNWLALQENFQRFSEMPDEVRAFISNPTNSSFIALAMWFSALGVNDLRGIAESILHLSRLEADKMQQIAEGILNDITL